ncbi:MAG: DUF1353 domain-containing protein [Burkholderiales bacterium]
MKKLLLWLVTVVMFTTARGAEVGNFEGKVVVEWIDDPFVVTMRLVEDFKFRQARGKVWTAPRGQVLDGKGMPPLFRTLVGMPFDGGFRKAAVVYDAAAHRMTEPWEDAMRMFYEAALAEGVPPAEAKVMYMVLATQGSRWEVLGTKCFGSCHGDAKFLEWRPVVDERKVLELLEWVRTAEPSLREIDLRSQSAMRATGPHIFTQSACNEFSGSTRVKKSCDGN